jgi:poly(A) polymerase
LARKRLKELRYSKDFVEEVAQLVFLHLRFYGYRDGDWTDSAVRRYVVDAGALLPRLHKLVRSDCTTRNKRKAAELSKAYDTLEERIAVLKAQEELDAIRPDLSGNEIMEVLELKPGPQVGAAYKFLLELRMEHGPLGRDRAIAELKQWWAEQQRPPESPA